MKSWGSISEYLENKIIDHVFRNTPISSGSNIWVALYTSNPTSADVGTEVSSGSGYTRAYVSLKGSAAYPWTVASSEGYSTATNSGSITFPTPTGDWGTVTHWGLRDAATGGNLYFSGQLSTGSGVIRSGNDVYILSNHILIYVFQEYVTYLYNGMLNHLLNNVNFSSPGSSVYGALFYPNNTVIYVPNSQIVTVSLGTEISGSGYSRPQMNNWSSPVSGSSHNISGSPIFCSNATSNWNIFPIMVGLMDSPTSGCGNMLYSFNIYSYTSRTIGIYDKVIVNEGEVEIALNNSEHSHGGNIGI